MQLHNDEFPMMMELEAGMRDGCPKVLVGFGLYPLKNDQKTRDAGYDVFDDIPHVKIVVPADRTQMVFQPATDNYKKRFPQAWKAFEQRDVKPMSGMPIEEWPQVTRSMALSLKSINVPTVEALAEVHDGHIGKVPGGLELREKARTFLGLAKNTASGMAQAQENQRLRDQIQAMQAQITALGSGRALAAAPSPALPVDVSQQLAAEFADADAGLPPVPLDPEAAVKAARKTPARAAAR